MTANPRPAKAMIVAGVMSGTSADGVDVALVRLSPSRTAGDAPKLKLLSHSGFPYLKAVREDVLRAMEGAAMPAAEFSRLNWRLGSVYATCVARACAEAGVELPISTAAAEKPVKKSRKVERLELVGLHGQTIFHEARRATWQLGEAAVLRERLGVPIVSDFRPADVAAGGQGAPLVPMLDFCLFRSPTKNRVLLNLGGIANLTAIPAGAGFDGVLAFDTGPANMVVDALMAAEFGKSFDQDGKIALQGKAMKGVVSLLLGEPYFAATPPKSCGREQFGAEFVQRLREVSALARPSAADLVATATELTAASILDAYGRFCWTHMGQRAPLAKATELVAAGGGVHNATLMRRLTEGFAALGVKMMTMDEFGIGAQAKEAVAFALLAWLSWHGLPGNVPAATGASGPRVLGKVTC